MARTPTLVARAFALLLLCGLGSGCTGAYLWTLNRHAPPAQRIESHVYDARHALSLDVYRPAGTVGAPVVVFIHGGSWQNGSRNGYRFVGQALADGGALAIVPDYRKAPAFRFPAFMEDAAQAVAWARAHARELGGDPDRVYVMGHSAGAHIATLLAADARYLAAVGMQPRELRGVIALSGPYDFLPSTEPLIQVVFGKGPQWNAAEPGRFIDGDEPPFLIEHGNADAFVSPSDSVGLAGQLQRAGDEVELRVLPDVGHVGMIKGFLSPRHSSALADTLRYVGLGDRRVVQAEPVVAPVIRGGGVDGAAAARSR
jgi:acetyl esterase/lipase